MASEGRFRRVTVTAFAPGRANLIGEHTDYNGGLALPFAIESGVTVRVDSLAGGQVEAYALDLDQFDRFAAGTPEPASGWRAYVRGVVAELGITEGARVEISSNLPQGGGLSSSAALTLALALALGADASDATRLAQLSQRVENDWAGANTGLLDQLAILLGRERQAVRIDFGDLSSRQVPLHLGDWQLATIDSGAEHSHAESGYNERRAECDEAARILGVATLSQATEADAARLPEPLARRARHVISENARVDATVAALGSGDMQTVARLLDESHASLRDDYDASVPDVEATVARAKEAGAAGARMMGGGFGGVVLALFPPGADPPGGALGVRPSAGARIV
jgi:galactokinase